MAHTEKCRGCMSENKCDYITCRLEDVVKVTDFEINATGGYNVYYENGQVKTVNKQMLIDMLNRNRI